MAEVNVYVALYFVLRSLEKVSRVFFCIALPVCFFTFCPS